MSLARRIVPTTYMSQRDPLSLLERWLDDTTYAPRTTQSTAASSLASPLAAPLASDLVETDAAWILDIAVPGLGPGDVEVDVERRSLTVRASFTRDVLAVAEGEQGADEPAALADTIRVHHRTLPRGEVVFRYRVPASTDAASIEARIDKGMLRITMPKIAEAKVRSIPVHQA